MRVNISKYGNSWIQELAVLGNWSLSFRQGVPGDYPTEYVGPTPSRQPVCQFLSYNHYENDRFLSFYVVGLTKYASTSTKLPLYDQWEALAKIASAISKRVKGGWRGEILVWEEEPLWDDSLIRGRPLIEIHTQSWGNAFTKFEVDEEGINLFLNFKQISGDCPAATEIKNTIQGLVSQNKKGRICEVFGGYAELIDSAQREELANAYYGSVTGQ